MWARFYGLQSAYLLLWSAVERFTALAYGPAQPAIERTWRLGDDPRFRECVVAAGVAPSAKAPDSRDPTRARRIREDGPGAMFSWDAARHTVAHPGRTAFADGVLLRRSLIDLHDTFRLILLGPAARRWPTRGASSTPTVRRSGGSCARRWRPKRRRLLTRRNTEG